MRVFTALRITILHLMLVFCLAGAAWAEVQGAVVQETETSQAKDGKTKNTVILPTNRTVVNIVFSKIENGYIYSDSGKSYRMNSGTRVINNSATKTKMKLAELIFEGSTLVCVTFK